MSSIRVPPTPRPAERLNAIPFSGIRRMVERAAALERSGRRILHFEIGRPDFDTPEHIKAAASAALAEGQVHYSSNYGLPRLREAIARKLERENGLRYAAADEIIVTVGANEAVLIAFMALLNPGDEILVPDPAWLHYRWCAELCGATAVPVPCDARSGFVPDHDAVARRVTPRTRLLVVNSPHNPTGAAYPLPTLRALAQLAERKDLLVLSDEIYERIIYDDAEHVSMASLPGMRERVITVNGFSKAYSMTGWRLGYVAAPRELCGHMIRVHQYTTVCAVTFAQVGAIAAYEEDQQSVCDMVAAFDRRRQLLVEGLNGLRGVTCSTPRGAFYAFPDIRGTGFDERELADRLLDDTGIATVPGGEFGAAGVGHLRFSYAASEADLQEGINRMAEVLGRR